MILLDDEEIDKAYLAYMESDLPPKTDISRGANRAIIQAQLKKVVEWQEAKCAEHPEHNAYDDGLHFNLRRDCPQCMQALKKEAGL